MKEEISLFEYGKIMWKWKWLISSITVGITTIAAIVAFNLPNIYRSTAVIMPIVPGGGPSASFSQLGSVMGNQFVPGGFSSKENNQLIAILSSRTLTERVLKRLGDPMVMPVLYPELWDKKSNTWKSENPEDIPSLDAKIDDLRTTVLSAPNLQKSTVEISVESVNPNFARDVTNAYVAGLEEYVSETSLTKAERNRIFIEGMLEKNKKELLEAGKELSKFYASNTISNTGSLVNADISINKTNSKTSTPPEQNTVKNIPQQVYLHYLSQHRDLLTQVTNLLAQQYEDAKIQESKEALIFQVLDDAGPAIKVRPNKRQIVILAFAIGLLFSAFLAFSLK